MAFTEVTDATASRTVTSSDDEAFIVFSNAAPVLDLQNTATQSWAAGTVISGIATAGDLTINPNTSVTIGGSTANVTIPQDTTFTLEYTGSDEWSCQVGISAAQLALVVAAIQPSNDIDDLTNIAAVNYTGTTDTLALTDAFALLYYSNAALVTVTIPTNASVAFAVGTRIDLMSTGAGGLTLTTTSLTLLGSSPKKTIAQNEVLSIEKVATDTWAIIGGTAA